MLSDAFHDPHMLLLRLAALVLLITVHEYFHALLAWRLGDPTARNAGRVTLNPLKHLELFGTVMILFAPIGWGRPVPINPANFRNPVRDDMIVSFAGPASNLALGAVFGLLMRARLPMMGWFDAGTFAAQVMENVLLFLTLASLVGFGLGIFNLFPLHPLDGSHILRGLLPAAWRGGYEVFSHYSFFVLIAVFVLPSFLGSGHNPVVTYALVKPIYWLFNLTSGMSI